MLVHIHIYLQTPDCVHLSESFSDALHDVIQTQREARVLTTTLRPITFIPLNVIPAILLLPVGTPADNLMQPVHLLSFSLPVKDSTLSLAAIADHHHHHPAHSHNQRRHYAHYHHDAIRGAIASSAAGVSVRMRVLTPEGHEGTETLCSRKTMLYNLVLKSLFFLPLRNFRSIINVCKKTHTAHCCIACTLI